MNLVQLVESECIYYSEKDETYWDNIKYWRRDKKKIDIEKCMAKSNLTILTKR